MRVNHFIFIYLLLSAPVVDIVLFTQLLQNPFCILVMKTEVHWDTDTDSGKDLQNFLRKQ